MRKLIKSGANNFGSNKDIFGFDFPAVGFIPENMIYNEDEGYETDDPDFEANEIDIEDMVSTAKEVAEDMDIPIYDDYSEPYLCGKPFMITFENGYYEGVWIKIKEGTNEEDIYSNDPRYGSVYEGGRPFTDEEMNAFADKMNEYLNKLCTGYGWHKYGLSGLGSYRIDNSKKPIKSDVDYDMSYEKEFDDMVEENGYDVNEQFTYMIGIGPEDWTNKDSQMATAYDVKVHGYYRLGNQEGWLVSGTLKDIYDYCDDYFGMGLHPDYVCPADFFDYKDGEWMTGSWLGSSRKPIKSNMNRKSYIKEMAEEHWETGHPFGSDDFRYFVRLCKDDGYDCDRSDWNYYWECFEDCRSNMYLNYGTDASSLWERGYDAYMDGKFYDNHPNDLTPQELKDWQDGFDYARREDMDISDGSEVKSSRKPIKSAKSAIECFAISEEDAENVDELRETFPDDSDLRAALEDYFHIYDDYAEMSVNEFDKSFKEFIGSSVIKDNIKSSTIGNIKDDFSLGNITERQAELKLRMEGKSRNEAKNIVNKWKEHGVVKSSLDKAIKKAEDYFGTVASDCTVSCTDVITEHDRQQLEQIAADEGVDCQIGQFSVRFFDKEQILLESSLIDKYIKSLGRLIKETDSGELNDDRSARLNDKLDLLFDRLVDEKDEDIMYDQVRGEYSIKGEDVKKYIIEVLGEDYFEKNNQWNELLDSILPNIRDFATTKKEIAACYEVYKDLGKGNFEFVTSTLNKVEADSFKNNGFMVKSSKIVVSNIGVDNETVIEIYKDGHWEMVSLDNTPEGWSTDKQAKIFPSEDKARASSLLKRLQAAGYSEDNGTLKISQYNN